MTTPTPLPFAELRAALSKATPGEWTTREDSSYPGKSWRYIQTTDRKFVVKPDSFERHRHGETESHHGAWINEDNAAFIVAARNELPALLAALDAANEEKARLEQMYVDLLAVRPTHGELRLQAEQLRRAAIEFLQYEEGDPLTKADRDAARLALHEATS